MSSVPPVVRAVVVAVQLPEVSDGELASSLAELERLARTLGLDPIGRLTQRRGRLTPGAVLGDGKLKELARWTGGTGVVPTYKKPGRRRRDDDASDADSDDDAPATEAAAADASDTAGAADTAATAAVAEPDDAGDD